MKLAYASAWLPVVTCSSANPTRSVRPCPLSSSALGNTMFCDDSSRWT